MPYKQGDVIMRNKPWVYVLDEKHASSYCHYCFRRPIEGESTPLKRCTQCQFAQFCDQKCAKAAWKDHKTECKRLLLGRKQGAEVPEANIRLLARIISKVSRGERSDPPDACWPSCDRTYDSLCTHADKIQSSILQITAFTMTIEKLVAFLGQENMPDDKETIKDAYSKLIVNAMTLYDGARPYGIGAALPLGATRFDHACKPNADYMICTTNGCEIVIRALEDIASIEDVRICYCNCMDMTRQRQTLLQEHYYFLCQCEYCLDEHRDNMMRSVRCPQAFCDGAIPMTEIFTPKPCTKCGHLIPKNDPFVKKSIDLMSKVKDSVDAYTALFEDTGNSTADQRQLSSARNDLSLLYTTAKKTLFPLNIFYVKLIVHLTDQETEQGWKLYLEETNAYRYYHGFSSFLGIRLVLQGGYQVGARKFEEAKKSLEEAERILTVTHGIDHPVFKDMLTVRRCADLQDIVWNVARFISPRKTKSPSFPSFLPKFLV
ncbi:histone-lysine N-methyltransferase set-18-like [Paramacrobiotus metropolitanus]|uniref:histone-lysine N-methyltransferase set-18-like n=1 Tax=Paramacrobiotus metropolitanus TaxID=2943436 RepID=UPI0024465544|nr:histone-lysine N-methyltransferase set-18-like [Paramacrobiotus metropolitanus]